MKHTVRQLGSSCAHEVLGLHLWDKSAHETVRALRSMWSENGVLIFRRQSLSEDEFADFSALFGPLELTVRRDWASRTRPEVGIISNLKDGAGAPIGGLGDGEVMWHADQSYMLDPATGAGLYAVEIAQTGGTTRWANLAQAYAALPDRLKDAAEGKLSIFSYPKRLAGFSGRDKTLPPDQVSRTPDVVHPLVHSHPISGRKSLYMDPTCTIGIVGMPQAEADALLDELAEFATRPEFVYTHQWQVGDVVIWDNGFLLHQRDPFPPSEKRLMKRTTMFLPKGQHMVPKGMLAEAVRA